MASVEEAKHLGLAPMPKIDAYRSVSEDDVAAIRELCNREYLSRLKGLIPGYWGASCQTLATHLLAWLQIAGYEADLVVGEVNIHGNLEYETTLENIREEYRTRPNEGSQRLHMWITLGDDVIVDPGIADRLIKYYRVPEYAIDPIPVHRADQFGTMYGAHHCPMLVGADFAAKTNSVNPFDLLEVYKSQLR
ncbi:MAG: hypothetical protein EON58_20160 [Alphaproteobacteria bacterium]|nr:MAG: hypothetical protein EON58_20160 [Alphaproteobacteria bacterium]